MISIQTNTDSINAQNNLDINQQFQSKTIQALTSGYRINNSGDDAAGLAVANQLRDNITELTQGVQNASDATAQLQIVDGGLSNISTILDRLKTLATESASGTFTGDRNTLNQEYQGLTAEITRQATNIGLNAGGNLNQSLSVYIGGASTQANASVTVDLSGTSNAVDATSLGLAGGTPPATAVDTAANATSAITAINTAIQSLGLVQGAVGAGENKLQYATNLANSQITNYSTAESDIRDADVAAEAANLTKAQVLQQSSIAAMAQANSEPQAVLKLLQG